MYLTHLRLVNFRNHVRTEIELGPHLNCFVGQNAQGKSSILEAVEIAATGRSHRAARDTDLLHFGESWARVHAAARRQDRDVEVDILWRTEMPAARAKEIRVNGVPVRRGDLFGHVLIVASTPHDQDVVTGAPAHRRRLLDVVLSQISPAYFFLLAERMAAAACELGLDADTARTLAAETLHGAGRLANMDHDLARQRAAVTSKGGTTAAALAVLDDAAFTRQVQHALAAAAHRSAELAEMSNQG